MKIRVADYITNYLSELGTDTVFLLNGGGMMHLVDAIGRNSELRYVCSHHEQASSMSADGFARLTGKLGVCFATCGPGATNTLTGIVGAWQDSTPILFITGQSKTTQTIELSGIPNLRQFGTFEVNIVPIVKTVTKYSQLVSDKNTIRYHLEKAIHTAMQGRPGPVLLDIPLDVQGALIDPDELEGYMSPSESEPSNPAEIERIVTLLANSKRPIFLAGMGIRAAHATNAFRTLVERLNIPVLTTQLGKDVLHYDHPLFVGHPGPKGDRPGNLAIQTADLIISLGASLHSQTTGWENELFAPDAIKVQIDVDEAILTREKVNVDLKIKAEISDFIKVYLPKAKASGTDHWRSVCTSWKERYSVSREPHITDDSGINFYHFVDALSRNSQSNTCLVSDAGSAFYVMGQGYRLKEGQRFFSSGSLGAMGYALPAANGAAFASDDTQIICVTGDGSLLTNVHDLATMRHYQRDIKLFVINNDGYVSMRNTQKEFFGGLLIGADSSSGVYIPDIKLIAESYELPYVRCDKAENLDAIINEVLKIKGPVVCEIIAMRDQKIIPTVSSKRLSDGRMQSTPIHDMVPRLSAETLAQEVGRAIADTSE